MKEKEQTIPPGNKIYIASKTKHAPAWKELRDNGVNVISTWIDEAGIGDSPDLKDLAERCVKESLSCDAMIVYHEGADHLKGAFIEFGIALTTGKPIYLVGNVLPAGSAFTHLSNIHTASTISEAVFHITKLPTPPSRPEPLTKEEEVLQAAKDCAFNMYDIVDGKEVPWAKNKYEGDIGVKFFIEGWRQSQQSQPPSQPKEGEEKLYTKEEVAKIVRDWRNKDMDVWQQSIDILDAENQSLKSQLSGYGSVDFLPVLEENYQAQIAGFYNDDKTDEEKKMRQAVITEYEDLIAIYKSCKAKASLTSVTENNK